MRQWLGTGFLAMVLLTSYLVVLDGLMRPSKQSDFASQIEESQNEQLSEPLLLPVLQVKPKDSYVDSEKQLASLKRIQALPSEK